LFRRASGMAGIGCIAIGLSVVAVLTAQNKPVAREASAVGPVSVTGSVTVAAAGDIACSPSDASYHGGTGTAHACAQNATAQTISGLAPNAVLALGDVQYACGLASEFGGYRTSWGRFLPITHPVPGNHEYGDGAACTPSSAQGYFGFFGTHAGGNPRGWYSFDLGSWHVIALNSECHGGAGAAAVGGCQTGSPQETWLRADLAAHPAGCTLAFWHESRFTTAAPGEQLQTADLWNDLARAKADLVLAGHAHDYERFQPAGVTPTTAHAPVPAASGIREFVVGTGGRSFSNFTGAKPSVEAVRQDTTFGVLALTLRTGSYDWRFVASRGPAFTDSGTGTCH
jgi:hypothetical protein